ncbi:MAG TPA: hypothetical protein VF306_00480 [Pirellulales bacterium]
MEFSWQDITALTLVSLATGYLVLRGWRLFFARRGGQGCSSCGGCSGAPTAEPSLISLNLTPPGASMHRPTS